MKLVLYLVVEKHAIGDTDMTPVEEAINNGISSAAVNGGKEKVEVSQKEKDVNEGVKPAPQATNVSDSNPSKPAKRRITPMVID